MARYATALPHLGTIVALISSLNQHLERKRGFNEATSSNGESGWCDSETFLQTPVWHWRKHRVILLYLSENYQQSMKWKNNNKCVETTAERLLPDKLSRWYEQGEIVVFVYDVCGSKLAISTNVLKPEFLGSEMRRLLALQQTKNLVWVDGLSQLSIRFQVSYEGGKGKVFPTLTLT